MTVIKRGTGWAGNYSRFSGDEAKRYYAVLKEQGVPVLDEDFNLGQDMQLTVLTRTLAEVVGDASPNDGFKVVGTGANNNFTLSAGSMFNRGYRAVLDAPTTYLGQEITPPALTTPGGPRVDTVYLECWLDEVDPSEDPVIVDPVLGTETSRRLKLRQSIRVAEGASAPADFVDAGIPHVIVPLATLNRTATAVISAGMVEDLRAPASVVGRIAAHNADTGAHPALLSAFLLAAHPVGEVFTTVDEDFDPNISFGGTWVIAFGGRVLVGQDLAQAEFATLLQTGGEKTHTLSAAELAAHTHFTFVNATGSADVTAALSPSKVRNETDNNDYQISSAGGTPNVGLTSSSGQGLPHNNLQPYGVVRHWQRVA